MFVRIWSEKPKCYCFLSVAVSSVWYRDNPWHPQMTGARESVCVRACAHVRKCGGVSVYTCVSTNVQMQTEVGPFVTLLETGPPGACTAHVRLANRKVSEVSCSYLPSGHGVSEFQASDGFWGSKLRSSWLQGKYFIHWATSFQAQNSDLSSLLFLCHPIAIPHSLSPLFTQKWLVSLEPIYKVLQALYYKVHYVIDYSFYFMFFLPAYIFYP